MDLSKRGKNVGGISENLRGEGESYGSKWEMELEKSKKLKKKISLLEEKAMQLKVANEQKSKELEEITRKNEKIKKRQEMIPLIEQLKEHFRQLRHQLGSGSYFEDDEVDVDDMTYEQLLELGEKIGKVSKGVSEEQFHLLERGFKTEKGECSICQQELRSDVVSIKLRCGHWFDVECIREWLKRQKICPLCKEEIV